MFPGAHGEWAYYSRNCAVRNALLEKGFGSELRDVNRGQFV